MIYEQAVKLLVNAHKKRKDESLLFAVYFHHPRHTHDINLFEVLDGFGGRETCTSRRFFEITFPPPPLFGTITNNLRLFLTSVEELNTAILQKWGLISILKNAFLNNNAKIIFKHQKFNVNFLTKKQTINTL